jgi:hypothetical protein
MDRGEGLSKPGERAVRHPYNVRLQSMHTQFVAQLSPVILSTDIGITRTPPRAAKDRQDDYMENFDHHTLFYDVYEQPGSVVMAGPPLRNLKSVVDVAKLEVFGSPLRGRATFKDGWKTQRSSLPVGDYTQKLAKDRSFRISAGWLDVQVPIQPNHSDTFAGQRVLFTMSKDNDLTWIYEWAEFHAKVHGVTGVLLYDNNSTRYSPADVLATLASVPGIEAAVVVPWPFPYGPGPGPKKLWDSNYCQYSMIEHARRRFLSAAEAAVNIDIDELVVSDDQRTLFDHLFAEKAGAIRFTGQWVETVAGAENRLPRFADFAYQDSRRGKSLEKWAVVPAAVPYDYQWQVHGFGGGFTPPTVEHLKHRHFRGINYDWKYNRTQVAERDPDVHRVDEPLVRSMRAAGWSVQVDS